MTTVNGDRYDAARRTTACMTEKTVATYAEAEAVVRAFAAAHEVSWEEVEVVSR